MAGTWKQFMNGAFPERAEANERKERRMIREQKKLIPDDFLNKLAEMTDKNYHNEARLEIAKFIKDKKMIEAYEGIINIHQAVGYMPRGLSDTVYDLDHNFLLPRLKQKLGKGGASIIWSKL
jgi:hypothetical protein